MNKKKNWLFMLLWLLVAATSRIQYFIFGGQSIVDTYAYFSHAMMRAEKQEPVLNSGLSYAFTKGLSRLLWFTGNLIDAVGIYQLLIQILWIILLLIGISMLFGRIAGFVSSGILIVSPWILKSVFSVSPENYFMLYFSVLLVALGYFHSKAVKGEWHRSVWGRLYLKAVGFFVGMICIWNYLGWILFAMVVYVLIGHYSALKGKIRQQRQGKNLKEKKRIMGAGSQLFHLLFGWIIGSYATLMKYTGLTGNTLKEQFHWWISQFEDFPGRCQDVSLAFLIWLASAVLAGILCQLIYHVVKSKKMDGMEEETESVQETEEIRETEAVQDTEEVQEIKAVQIAEEIREIEVVQDTEEMQEIKAVQIAEEIREIEAAQTAKEVQETRAVQIAEEVRETETVQDAEEMQEVEAWQKEVQKVEMMQEAENDLKDQTGRNPGTEIYRRPESNPGTEMYRRPKQRLETEMCRKPEQETAENGRKVQFLDNPLPVPKKHVRKDMEFDFDEVKMDFDIDIGENDDFDI
ncbi:MAG: hypothetical protein HDQ97_08040 [Lachnospiraceae bacterium]|nr:hypothetical protein [Lachnospiraceae bacterium]